MGSWASILYPLLAKARLQELQRLHELVRADMLATTDPVLRKLFELVEYSFDDRILPLVDAYATWGPFGTTGDVVGTTSNTIFPAISNDAITIQVVQSVLAYAFHCKCPLFQKYYELVETECHDPMEKLFRKGFLSALIIDMVLVLSLIHI